MKIKKVIGVCILIICVACSDPNRVCGCLHPTNIDIALSFEDQTGNDLLDPEHENAITEDNLDVFYRKDGSYAAKLNGNDSYEIIEREDENNFVHLQLSSDPFEDRYASILIDFPNTTSDTLDMQAKGPEDELYETKMWYNGELIWSQGEDVGETGHYFEVVKTVNPD